MLPIHKVDAENVTVVLFAGSLFTFFLWVFPNFGTSYSSGSFRGFANVIIRHDLLRFILKRVQLINFVHTLFEFLVVFKVLHNLEFRILTELFH